MKWLEGLSEEVEQIYERSNETFSKFQLDQEMPCPTGCGKCCLSKEISATVLEMLPTAIRLFKENKHEVTYDKLGNQNEVQCIFFNPHIDNGNKGLCENYQTRPSVCRSFGLAAVRGKAGDKKLSVCKVLKEIYPDKIMNIALDQAPVVGEYARQIIGINPGLGAQVHPINEALRLALQKVILYTQFE